MMEYRLGNVDDILCICNLVEAAINTMQKQGIMQWDELYPTREDFMKDIKNKTLYVSK